MLRKLLITTAVAMLPQQEMAELARVEAAERAVLESKLAQEMAEKKELLAKIEARESEFAREKALAEHEKELERVYAEGKVDAKAELAKAADEAAKVGADEAAKVGADQRKADAQKINDMNQKKKKRERINPKKRRGDKKAAKAEAQNGEKLLMEGRTEEEMQTQLQKASGKTTGKGRMQSWGKKGMAAMGAAGMVSMLPMLIYMPHMMAKNGRIGSHNGGYWGAWAQVFNAGNYDTKKLWKDTLDAPIKVWNLDDGANWSGGKKDGKFDRCGNYIDLVALEAEMDKSDISELEANHYDGVPCISQFLIRMDGQSDWHPDRFYGCPAGPGIMDAESSSMGAMKVLNDWDATTGKNKKIYLYADGYGNNYDCHGNSVSVGPHQWSQAGGKIDEIGQYKDMNVALGLTKKKDGMDTTQGICGGIDPYAQENGGLRKPCSQIARRPKSCQTNATDEDPVTRFPADYPMKKLTQCYEPMDERQTWQAWLGAGQFERCALEGMGANSCAKRTAGGLVNYKFRRENPWDLLEMFPQDLMNYPWFWDTHLFEDEKAILFDNGGDVKRPSSQLMSTLMQDYGFGTHTVSPSNMDPIVDEKNCNPDAQFERLMCNMHRDQHVTMADPIAIIPLLPVCYPEDAPPEFSIQFHFASYGMSPARFKKQGGFCDIDHWVKYYDSKDASKAPLFTRYGQLLALGVPDSEADGLASEEHFDAFFEPVLEHGDTVITYNDASGSPVESSRREFYKMASGEFYNAFSEQPDILMGDGGCPAENGWEPAVYRPFFACMASLEYFNLVEDGWEPFESISILNEGSYLQYYGQPQVTPELPGWLKPAPTEGPGLDIGGWLKPKPEPEPENGGWGGGWGRNPEPEPEAGGGGWLNPQPEPEAGGGGWLNPQPEPEPEPEAGGWGGWGGWEDELDDLADCTNVQLLQGMKYPDCIAPCSSMEYLNGAAAAGECY